MAKLARSEKSLRWVLLFLALAAILAGLQVWNAVSISQLVRNAEIAASPTTPKDQLERETARQELINKRIENDTKGALPIGLTAGLSAAVAALATILGAILALGGYLDAREKERQDRLGTALNDTLTRLVSTEWRQRVVGAAGLLPFFTADRGDFHRQALTALMAAARLKDEEPAVRQGIRLAVEQAVRTVAPALLAEVSWQGVRLPDVNLVNTSLARLDLRDAELENARLSGAKLDGTDLTNARLQGARLDGTTLKGAVLTYADLAGATLAGAVLSGATLSNVKVLNLDLDGADLRAIGPGWRGVPWDASRNWRQATFDAPVRAELDRLYGPAAPKLRVLMLMWEIPPMVAGGTWTACYHLVRNLRRRGADVTVVVPWARKTLLFDPPPFGIEVPVVTLDIEVPADSVSGGAWSPYSNAAMPAPYTSRPNYSGWSPYGSGGALWSGYTASAGGPDRSPYASSYGVYGAGSLSGSVLFRLIGAFAQRLRDYVVEHPADLIHAHDWVTFDAARAASERIGVPWVAHFHSTEADRQPDETDPLTERIEQGAVDSATCIVAVSEATRRTLIAAYDTAGRRRIDVVPNSLSEGAAPTAEMGRFETHRVVFLGRLSSQKGVDRFCEVAERVRSSGFIADFLAYGDGPDRWLLWQRGVTSPGPLGWDMRGTAFRGASALLVPSRSEPFGMVILEAMQHRVPVIYPEESGAAEVLQSGVKVASGDTAAMASAVMRLLGDLGTWEEAVAVAAHEIEGYPERGYEDRLIAVWSEAVSTWGV
ncbi:MAG TPA: glycosyltransferase [Acetobacteraceae bacterium]|nr:glycosyltransferase [Acetobacteraceae bacterium]